MKLAIKTCTLDMPYEEMLDFCVSQKIAAIEIGTGNWSGAPHCDLDLLVSDRTAREKWYDAMRAKGLELCALNCSGNPLAYEKEMDVTKKTFELAQMLGVKKIVMMSGLPAGCRGDKTPVWITTSWPPETQEILDYQWNEVAIPVWKDIVKMAEDCGIERIALENHGMQLVYNPETLLRLREAVGPMVGMNLDPSHRGGACARRARRDLSYPRQGFSPGAPVLAAERHAGYQADRRLCTPRVELCRRRRRP